jgi:hypothetical protein
MNQGDVFIAAGIESMTRVPMTGSGSTRFPIQACSKNTRKLMSLWESLPRMSPRNIRSRARTRRNSL